MTLRDLTEKYTCSGGRTAVFRVLKENDMICEFKPELYESIIDSILDSKVEKFWIVDGGPLCKYFVVVKLYDDEV